MSIDRQASDSNGQFDEKDYAVVATKQNIQIRQCKAKKQRNNSTHGLEVNDIDKDNEV
eukprot:SAG31_NODE_2103_length_6437_cov_11.451040_1_plen_58_part_00